ncbi:MULTISPECIES: hypothetical protein [Chitinibacter]|uniref:hypothetical protein n=1 Tax=Chitinibacter TaxID=230666 RepID=UPI000426B520|nr:MULTISPECIES: hypothetical protein [Chitinibacter]
MNPKTLDALELIAIEDEARKVMETAKTASYLYQTARRLRSVMQLEMIRRGLFERQKRQLLGRSTA